MCVSFIEWWYIFWISSELSGLFPEYGSDLGTVWVPAAMYARTDRQSMQELRWVSSTSWSQKCYKKCESWVWNCSHTYIIMLSFEILTLARLVSHMLTDPSPTRKIYLVLMNNSCSFRFLSLHFCEDDVIDTVIMFGYSSTDNCIFLKQTFCSWDYYIYMRFFFLFGWLRMI